MSKYAELDQLILGKVNHETPTPFYKIHLSGGTGSDIFLTCERMSTTGTDGFRVLDRRLQALRKAGKIKSVPGKGWIKLNEGE